MNVNPVRYENPNPQPSPFAALLNGVIQGGAGQVGMQQQQAAKQQEDNQKYMSSLLTALAQQNRVNPAQAGSQGAFPFAGQNWSIGQPPVDYGNMKNQVEAQKMQRDFNDPDGAMWRDITKKSVSDNLAFGDANNRGPEDIIGLIEQLKQGIGPETPGDPGSKGLLGSGIFGRKATLPTRQKITKNGMVTQIFQDGAWVDQGAAKASKAEAKDPETSRAPDSYGYVLGQEADVPGKGKHIYLGNNKWQKM